MGKRKKRLTMAKYAKKYASIRATVARLRGETAEENNITENVETETLPNALKATTTITNEENLLTIEEPQSECVVINPIPPVEEENTDTETTKVETPKENTTRRAKTTKKATKTTTRKRRTKKTANAE